MNEDMKNLTKSVDTIAQTTAQILEVIAGIENRMATKKALEALETKMATKEDLNIFKLETNIHFNNLESDLKSFKNETRDRFDKLDEKFDDLNDTVMNHDKRIETLEVKVFGTPSLA